MGSPPLLVRGADCSYIPHLYKYLQFGIYGPMSLIITRLLAQHAAAAVYVKRLFRSRLGKYLGIKSISAIGTTEIFTGINVYHIIAKMYVLFFRGGSWFKLP